MGGGQENSNALVVIVSLAPFKKDSSKLAFVKESDVLPSKFSNPERVKVSGFSFYIYKFT